jgi:hypothetical protein
MANYVRETTVPKNLVLEIRNLSHMTLLKYYRNSGSYGFLPVYIVCNAGIV